MKNECGFYKVIENPSIKTLVRKKQNHSISGMVKMSTAKPGALSLEATWWKERVIPSGCPMNSVYTVCSEFTDSQTHTSVIAGL